MAWKQLRTARKTYGRTIRGLRASIAPRVARYARRLRGGDAQTAPRDCHLSTHAESAEEPLHEAVLSTALVRALHALLPETAVVRVGWDDPQLGSGRGGWPLHAIDSAASVEPATGDGQHGWEYDGARLLLSVALYLLSTNIGEDVLLILLLALFIHPILLLPIQILWINLVTDGFLDISLAMEPKEEGLLDKPPRSLDQRILSKDTLKLGLFYAIIMVIGSLAVYTMFQDTLASKIRTAVFMVLIIFQWFNAFNCRSHNNSVFSVGVFTNKTLWVFLVIDVLLVAMLFVIPPLTLAFDIVPLGIMDWVIIALIGSSIWIIDEIRKKLQLFTVQD